MALVGLPRDGLGPLRAGIGDVSVGDQFQKHSYIFGLLINAEGRRFVDEDLRDDLDAKERLVLDHKDKIRELERARRDLDEKTLGFERNLVAASEKVAELAQDRDKSGERERGLKARLDDAHEELRKSHEAVDGLKKKFAQDEARLRLEMDRVRTELETRLVEADENHGAEFGAAGRRAGRGEAAASAAREAERARSDAAHKVEVEGCSARRRGAGGREEPPGR